MSSTEHRSQALATTQAQASKKGKRGGGSGRGGDEEDEYGMDEEDLAAVKVSQSV